MRQRTTFFHHNEDAIDPASLKVSGRTLSGPIIKAVREDRFTLGLDELPAELQELLRLSQELYIRWTSPVPYQAIGPWSSRLSPGLHVFFTPQADTGANVASDDELCLLLRRLGPVDCSSPQKSFSRLPNDRFSHATALEYYQPVYDLAHFVDYAVKYVCASSDAECETRFGAVKQASSLDFSYDTISHVVKVTALWGRQDQSLSISAPASHRVEVGLLTPNQPPHLEEYEIGVTGLLTVLGEDSKPAPTMFTFPSRHKQAGTGFSSSFLTPTGLHPTMQLNIKSTRPPMEDSACALHALVTLPRTIFADKYQLEDPLFLGSKNLTALRYISQPVDLEAPDYVMDIWGSSVLLELNTPVTETKEGFTAEIPLHLRYQAPQHGGESTYGVPYPAVFWACAAEEGTKFPSSPFDRINLGYDGLFGPRTLFWHLDPIAKSGGDRLIIEGKVPVLDLDKSRSINTVTSIVVGIGFAWVIYKLLMVYMRTGYGVAQPVEATEKKKQ
ncbi:PIG-X-domain-containing protein [Apiospora sp. TS-2023a]